MTDSKVLVCAASTRHVYSFGILLEVMGTAIHRKHYGH